ncbi:MAG: CHAT domain-containing protein, partial [Acidobacteria bacterium]|nr:CHAT domain-containing protein [Acidobacteriota bacterium]
MPSHFDLIITADYPNRTADLRLNDAHGSQLAFRQTDFRTITVSRQQGLFDLRNYLRNYVEPGREAASVSEIGVCIAEQVLGDDIFRKLWESEAQRTLRIQLPGATEEENRLAAALARVPWEIARPAVGQPTLGERNLLVRIVHDMKQPATQPLDLGKDECLRVLFVFAEARGSRPLAARLERRELLRLFEKEIYPQRRVVADFLTHGVTRERLETQIADRGGYHIVHWSGHGHLNLLELARPGGAQDHLSGDDLLDLFTRSGGFIPSLFFLSACHSGDILRVKDWNDFLAIAQAKEPGTKHTPAAEAKEIPLDEQPGYTGTAHALLQGGVPSVVAMRYAVGDDYARDLGIEFYRALLAHTQPKHVAAALTMARQSLLDPLKHNVGRYDVCDHATPVLYGAEQPGLTLQNGISPSHETRNRRLHQIAELTTARHEHFVGRTWELAGLGSDFIGSRTGAEVKPVALITGLGGMGKTALTAEALALWESHFEWVLLYQAKPNALGYDATLRDIHMKLNAELGRYYEHVKSHPADVIFRTPDAEFTGPERLERLTRNLVRALRDEPILLVLDNFETSLKPQAEAAGVGGKPVWACQDPAWDHCLALLAAALVGTPSRVLITSRRPLALLAETDCQRVLLGPLPAPEAALYLREHAGLSKMVFSGDAGEKALAMRLLTASRFHPLLMDRLARLATGGAALRPQLLQALNALEKTKDFTQLPALFATGPADANELNYLNDALATSLDHLIRDAGPDARRLLWMIAVVNDPVGLGLLKGVWSGERHEQEQLRQIKRMLDILPSLPQALQATLTAMPPQIRTVIDALPPEPPARPDLVPLLRHLVAVGLATEERTRPDDDNPALSCHELVRERISAWMHDHPEDRDELTENAILLAYAERLEAVFHALRHQNMTAALEAGRRALVY